MALDDREKSVFGETPVEVYLFQRSDGYVLGRGTSYHAPVTLSVEGTSQAYNPIEIHRGAIDFTGEKQTGEVKVTLARNNSIATAFMGTGPIMPVWVNIYRTFLNESEFALAFWGEVSGADLTGTPIELTLLPFHGVLARKVPRIKFQSHCNWTLGDDRCKVNMTAFTHSGTVTGFDEGGAVVYASVFSAHAAGYFTGGTLKANATGAMALIVEHPAVSALGVSYGTTSARLMLPCTGLVVSNAITVKRGCLRTTDACDGFSNRARFGGFMYWPSRNVFTVVGTK